MIKTLQKKPADFSGYPGSQQAFLILRESGLLAAKMNCEYDLISVSRSIDWLKLQSTSVRRQYFGESLRGD